jgi:ATP-GRASP peptide maturase of grasp-with-spasm system
MCNFLEIKLEAMVLILTDSDEPTTDWVIDWLYYLNKPFIRISKGNVIYIKTIYEHANEFECIFEYKDINNNFISIDTATISSYWYRRSSLRGGFQKLNTNNEIVDQTINEHILEEQRAAIAILNLILNRKNRINRIEDNHISKIGILQSAKDIGIKTPATLICSEKKDLIPFYEAHEGKVITKSIGDPTALFFQNFHCFTNKINIDEIPEHFGLSLFQEMIEKFVELRLFYLKRTFYGSAIFSQLDPQTKIDFKNYNYERPNRVVPYKLPSNEEEKFQNLMHINGLTSGSLDIVLTPKYEYVFLEVNPIGQFEQVSVPCNYNLFKTIAEIL